MGCQNKALWHINQSKHLSHPCSDGPHSLINIPEFSITKGLFKQQLIYLSVSDQLTDTKIHWDIFGFIKVVNIWCIKCQYIHQPELCDSEGRVLLRLGALLSRERFLGLGGTVGGLGWCGGVKHLRGLCGPGGLTGLRGVERWSALVEVSVLPFRCRSTTQKITASRLWLQMDKSIF